ncbi:MAG TPA: nucleotide sugar dehydrogenase, partial [Candidatus Saccharimonadaceae bacterium]|nr:nucleotide sugar dehydrogenase [Candidatus Saccharimonadaceae bacterium]
VREVLDVYRTLETHRDTIASLAAIDTNVKQGEYIETDLESAELIKVSSNAFLALKISFANSIAILTDAVGADITKVMAGVGADARIGQAFLNAGRGYGGGCFPKDVSGLIASGLTHGVELEIMQAARDINSSMPGYVVEKLQTVLGGSIRNKTIAVLGLSFKSGTSDVRRSPSIALANLLDHFGAVVQAYDPQAMAEAAPELHDPGWQKDSAIDALQGADAVIIATNWLEFDAIEPSDYKHHMRGRVFVDAMNHFDRVSIESAGLTYLGIGR